MQHVVVTGAAGFIGQHLVARLLRDGRVGDHTGFTRLTVTDLDIPPSAAMADPRLRIVRGSLADAAVRRVVLDGGVDCLFHLAAIPGGLAEREPALGLEVNVLGTLDLARALTQQAVPARLVLASTIAVFGVPLPGQVDDDTLPLPTLSYGAHKLAVETLLADMGRRGVLDARCVRLSGVLARPWAASGLVSAFMSDMFHALRANQPITLPVSAEGTVWALSVARAVTNLLHAAALPPAALPGPRRAWTLPALRCGIGQLVDGIAAAVGRPATLVRYQPVPEVEAQFARYPVLHTPAADALGFRADPDTPTLVRAVLAQLDGSLQADRCAPAPAGAA